MTAKGFAYRALTAPDSTRLLLLDPAQDGRAALGGSLLHTTLAESQTGHIIISGHAVTITATLAAALSHLRDATRPRRIWADALCIDQSNIAERNRQVTLMGAIYKLAGNTVIFLGSSTKGSDLVLTSAPRASLGLFPRLDETQRHAVVQAAKTDVLTRPWFRRVWVFQELILSRDPWVQCGHCRTRWTDLCGLLLFEPPPKSDDDLLQMLYRMDRSRQRSNAGKMLSLLQARRGLGATDARDFVFAHMGVASDRQNVRSAIPVDYGMPLAKTFARMALYVAQTEGVQTLASLLDQQPAAAVNPDLPSWAVDWSVTPAGYAPMYVDNLTNRAKLVVAPIVCVEEESILSLVGHPVAIIETLSFTLPPSTSLDLKAMVRYQETVTSITSIYSSTGGVYYTGDSAGRQARVSVRNHEQEHKELCATLFGEWTLFLQALRAGSADASGAHAEFLQRFSAWAQQQSREPRVFVSRESTDMLLVMWEYLHPSITSSTLDGRRLATTATGNLGVVPAGAKKGDHVINVMGSQVSLVLRPVVDFGVRDAPAVEQRLKNGLRSIRTDVFMDGVSFTPEDAPVRHYVFVGCCCFDGQVPWAVTQLPQLPQNGDDMMICALH